jgi:hypothetical protein
MKKMIIGKLIKNIAIIGLALILTLCCLGLTGCGKWEEQDNPQIEEPQLNVEVLEKEYNAMIGLVENVFFMLSEHEGQITMTEAIDMLEYVQKNRINPTQELTIALDESIDDLMQLLIEYYMASESEKSDVEARIIETLEYMNNISLEIEKIIEEHNEII